LDRFIDGMVVAAVATMSLLFIQRLLGFIIGSSSPAL
jgi:hypothetical protein